MKQFPQRTILFLVVSLFLGWFFDYLFWEKSIGVNYAFFLTASLLGGFIVLLAEGYRPHSRSLWALIPFFFFATLTFLRREQLTQFLAYSFSLFSLGVLASTYHSGRWAQYILPDYVYRAIILIVGVLQRPAQYFFQLKRNPNPAAQKTPIGAILRGLTLALPIVLCFGSLLASADLVFGKMINDLFDIDDFIFETIPQIIRIAFYAVLAAGVFLYTFSKDRDIKLAGEDAPLVKTILGFTESSIVIGSVSVLFLLFVIIQFQYFFGGQSNIGVEGYTYSQYARRGFSELNLVSLFSLLLIIGLNILTHHETEKQRITYSSMSIFMVALVMVILVSSYQRLELAIDWHGYSRLRLYPRTYLVWLGALLITIAGLQIARKERYFTFAVVLASLGFAAHLSLLNVDQAIIKHNIPRFLEGKNLNVGHLSSLSADGVPALIEEFNNPNYPAELHEGIGAVLLCYINSNTIKYNDFRPDDDWRSFNLSSWEAYNALEKIEPQLAGYKILKKHYPMIVTTPGNIRYECMTKSADF